MSRRAAGVLVGAGALAALAAAPAFAAGNTSIGAPTVGGAAGPLTYTGTIPAGSSNSMSVCPTTGQVDAHTVTWTGPADPATTQSTFTVSIAWTPSNPSGSEMANDEVLSIADSTGTVLASSDGSDASESVSLTNATSGVYTVLACGYVNTTAQPYTGTVTASSAAVTHAPAPVAETPAGAAPSPALPEAATAVGIPLAAMTTIGLIVVWRRRRWAAPEG